jgi:hypothetical protein
MPRAIRGQSQFRGAGFFDSIGNAFKTATNSVGDAFKVAGKNVADFGKGAYQGFATHLAPTFAPLVKAGARQVVTNVAQGGGTSASDIRRGALQGVAKSAIKNHDMGMDD